jgi:signal transduction histidine kinase
MSGTLLAAYGRPVVLASTRLNQRGRSVPLWARRAPGWVDIVLGVAAAAAAVVAVRSTDAATVDVRLHDPTVWIDLLTFVGGLGLVWRRTHPLRGFVVLWSAAVLVSALGYYIGLLGLLLIPSLLSLAIHCRRRMDGFLALCASVLSLGVLALANVPDLRLSDLGENAGLFVAAWAVGDAVRSRRSEQVERVQVAEWEVLAARKDAMQAATEERLRIARELHDVVAHNMSLIAVQAGVGAHVIANDPAAAERALEVIAETSRHALTQTRALLAVLRSSDDVAQLPLTPGIRDLDDLADRVRQSGLAVDISVTGEPRVLSEAIGLATYRIVQESLTNVIKHANAQRVRIGLTYDADWLRLDVTDDGRSASRPAQATIQPGHGLAGLRERAHLVGGSCSSGPGESGGYSVRADLPAPGIGAPP